MDYVFPTVFPEEPDLPPVMGESFVGLRHFMGVLPFLDGRSGIVEGVQQLTRQRACHRLSAFRSGESGDPPESQSHLSGCVDFHRYLVGGSTDPPAFDFQSGFDVFESLEENLERFEIFLKFLEVQLLIG